MIREDRAVEFLFCPLGDYYLGVPAESAAFLLVNSRETGETVEWDEETGDVYFSLPRYLGFPDAEVHHGIVIKESERPGDRDRKILLVPSVEKIQEIPLQNIKKMPDVLQRMEGVSCFTGICFGESAPVLCVDPAILDRAVFPAGGSRE
jgi:hypothetical protein